MKKYFRRWLRCWLGIEALEDEVGALVTIGKLVINIEKKRAFVGEIKSIKISRYPLNGTGEVDMKISADDIVSKIFKAPLFEFGKKVKR